MRKFKKFAALGLACAMMIGSIVPVSAADVSVSEGDTQSAKTNISLVKEILRLLLRLGFRHQRPSILQMPQQLHLPWMKTA